MASRTIDERLIPQIQYVTPTTGQTVNVNTNGCVRLIVNPSGLLATLTITMPGSPQDGDVVELGSSQIVTTLTMNGGTIIGALASLAVGGFATYIFSTTANQWFRTG